MNSPPTHPSAPPLWSSPSALSLLDLHSSRACLANAIHTAVVPGLVPGTHWRWRRAMPYYVYILASRKHGTLYIGVTNDIARRVWEHRESVGSRFVMKYRVTRLVLLAASDGPVARSEEHTSELQSLMRTSYAV